MKNLFFVLILLSLFACNKTLEKSQTPITIKKAPLQEYYHTSCDSIIKDKYLEIKDVQHNQREYRVFRKSTPLHCSPDTNSQIVGTFNFNDKVIAIGQIGRYTEDTFYTHSAEPERYQLVRRYQNWWKIKHFKTFAYVKQEDMATVDMGGFGFLAGLKNANDSRTIELRALSGKTNPYIWDTCTLGGLMHGYEVKPLGLNGLIESGQLIQYRTYREACPGANLHELIVLHKKGFTKLLSAFSTGEMGEYEEEVIYYPIKFYNGTIRLVANADLENALDLNTGELRVYPYPKDIGIPIERLIVKTKVYTETIFDENNEPVMQDEWTYKVKIVKDKPKFYKWENYELTEVK